MRAAYAERRAAEVEERLAAAEGRCAAAEALVEVCRAQHAGSLLNAAEGLKEEFNTATEVAMTRDRPILDVKQEDVKPVVE